MAQGDPLSKMSTPEAETFRHYSARLVENVQCAVQTVANDTFSASLLSTEELGECLKDSLSEQKKASALIETIFLKVDVDPSGEIFKKFLGVLKNDSSRDFLTEEIGESLLTLLIAVRPPLSLPYVSLQAKLPYCCLLPLVCQSGCLTYLCLGISKRGQVETDDTKVIRF